MITLVWVLPIKKMHFHNSSVKNADFRPKIEPKLTKYVHFIQMMGYLMLFLLDFE